MITFPAWMDDAVAALEGRGRRWPSREAWETVRPAVAAVHAATVDPFTEPAPSPTLVVPGKRTRARAKRTGARGGRP